MLRWRMTVATFSAAALCGCGQQLHAPGGATRAAPGGSASAAVIFETWRIRVSERPSRIAQLTITLKGIAHIEQGQAAGRIVTRLLIRNSGRSPVSVALAPTSTFIGNRRLLVATPDCGYAQQSPGGEVKPGACLAILRVPPEINPGGHWTAWDVAVGRRRLKPSTATINRHRPRDDHAHLRRDAPTCRLTARRARQTPVDDHSA
jgi:hypothetical protein